MGPGVSADPQRAAALRVLTRVRRDAAWIHSALEAEPKLTAMPSRERAFVTALVRGTVEHEGTLDAMIDRWAAKSSGIEPRVRDALRLAAYEIVYLSTPDRAAVNEGVELVRSVQPRAAGLANAVLHRIAEAAADGPFGDVDNDLEAFASATGHPLWLAELLAEDLGTDVARTVMTANDSPAPLYLAHNPFATGFEELMDELVSAGCEPQACDVPGSIVCANASATVGSAALREGRAIVCDLAAQGIVAATPVVAGETLFEAAAGRGTKTLLLQSGAVRAGGQARIVAADVHEFKTLLLVKRMLELGVPGVTTATLDSRDLSAAREALGSDPGVVFVDAPCSGLGALRRHPEKRWRITPQEIDEVASLAEQLLATALRLVRPGGFVVYSTCTLTRRENVGVVTRALDAAAREFEIVPMNGLVAASLDSWVTPEGHFQSLPRPGGPDGHFAALIRRND